MKFLSRHPKGTAMPKMPWKVTSKHASGLLRLWKEVHSVSVSEIAQEAERPILLTITGSSEQTDRLATRLSRESPVPKNDAPAPADIRPFVSVQTDASTESLRLDADVLTDDETLLAQALAQIAMTHPELSLSLARHIPAFRPAVVTRLIAEWSWTNAKIATLSALPGVLPFTSVVLPLTAVGDTLLLTKNQGLMLLRIAAAYGLPVDLRARTRELIPVVGSAFGWRALARELVGLVPGGIGVVLKGSIAYAGTYTVGKAAHIYYSTGHTLTAARLKQLGRDAAKEARIRLRREKPRRGLSTRAGGAEISVPSAAIDIPVQIGV
jgi:uncharacterized protein (DUF697 family)